MSYIIWFKDCSYKNKQLVGGKCSSLGELHNLSKQIGFSIADGFAITTELYDAFIKYNNLNDIIIDKLSIIDTENIKILEMESLILRELIITGSFTSEHEAIIIDSYKDLCDLYKIDTLDVAVRSSAIAEDLPNASFAGQQDTYLNIRGADDLLISVKKCFASLFNSRAISYRKTHNIQLFDIKISVAIQKMVRSDIGSAGVAFSIDPETGYNKAIVINSAFGLGELVVSGGVKPDEFILDKRVLQDIRADPIIMKKNGEKNSKIIYKDENRNGGVKEIETNLFEKSNLSLTDTQAIILGYYVLKLEENYSKMFEKQLGIDVEWAIDGIDQNIYIIQTRPETIHSNNTILEISKYILKEKSELLVTGVAVGDKISSGKIKILHDINDFEQFNKGDILVTEMTTPDWEPIMKISAGIITNKGGRTCHAAIVARELGLNAIVGTSNGTKLLKDIETVTISCAEGEQGQVYKGLLQFEVEKIKLDNDLKLPIKLMLNVGNPESCFSNANIPHQGVGLARMEFIISNYIKVHPLALCNYPNIRQDIANNISNIITPSSSSTVFDLNLNVIRGLRGQYPIGKSYFVEQLARGISKIASVFYPNDVIVRLSDFKSNEYKNLLGGELYEPDEENPMIGWRGASRYYSKEYEPAFELECLAIKYAREVMMMSNIIVMIPFCRTPTECKRVIQTMEKYGLTRGILGLKIYLMCEIPSNVIEADQFSPMIDGVSIGGNDLLQLTLGVDRDSERITYLSDDKNLSYRRMISMAIKTYKENGIKVGFCGQQPSDSIEFCQFLIDENIDSISVTPDSALKTIKNLGVYTLAHLKWHA
jgi:pyruvate,water dikinase